MLVTRSFRHHFIHAALSGLCTGGDWHVFLCHASQIIHNNITLQDFGSRHCIANRHWPIVSSHAQRNVVKNTDKCYKHT